MAKLVAFVLLVLVVAVTATRESRESRGFRDLKPRSPKAIFQSEGGRIEEWVPSDYSALCDAEVGAKRITLEKNGLHVPAYCNAPVLKMITKGSARAGIINPYGDRSVQRNIVLNLKKGDLLAVPKGVACWFYNDGNEATEIVEIADTNSTPECGRFRTFLLAGSGKKPFGSVLQGFSREMVAHAWDVEEQTVERMLIGAKEAAIIKVDEQRMRLPLADADDESTANTLFTDFLYRFKQSTPDVRVEDAGEVRLLSSLKLPVLKKIKMAAACVHMQEGALTAPAWTHNAHGVMYVDSGRARVQIVRETGEQALDTEVEEGTLLIIPENFPCIKLAGESGFRYATVFTDDRPVESYLAGRNSVYQGMPRHVVSSAFQIDDRLLQQLAKTRTEESYLFPPRRQQPRKSDEEPVIESVV